ncbi:MAG: RNA polymerase subunit sigma [Acidobacteria bacterium]|nr:RNA polymerase subunit sigma [Acidobacteriota bacterium]
MKDAADILAEALDRVAPELLLVVTGAGISLASGIPTFRGSDPGAVWARDVTELGTYRYFRRDPVGSWRWYLERFDAVLGARPNAAHDALVALEGWQLSRGGEFQLITQNIDTLHEAAGSKNLIKVHGSADRVRCAKHGCPNASPRGSLGRSEVDLDSFRAEPNLANLPRCPICGDLLRQHVLWFDEYYNEHIDYQFDLAQKSIQQMGLGLFVGTSFSVGITEMALQSGTLWSIPMYAVDPSAAFRLPGLTLLSARAEELLPEVCRRLQIPLPEASSGG